MLIIIKKVSDANIYDVKLLLKEKFEMEGLGRVVIKILGIEVIRSKSEIWLLQRHYGLVMLL